jgi:hypothetical protein
MVSHFLVLPITLSDIFFKFECGSYCIYDRYNTFFTKPIARPQSFSLPGVGNPSRRTAGPLTGDHQSAAILG